MSLFRRTAKVQDAAKGMIYVTPTEFSYRGSVSAFLKNNDFSFLPGVDAKQLILAGIDTVLESNAFGSNVFVYGNFRDGAVDKAETGEASRTLVVHISADPS